MARRLEIYDMAGDDGDGRVPQLTEPNLVTTLHVSGVQVVADGQIVRLTWWDRTPAMAGALGENRVVDRQAMTRDTAHDLFTKLRAIFSEEH